MVKSHKIPFVFRRTEANRFTIPVLFSILEKESWEAHFSLSIADSFPHLLSMLPKKRPSIVAYSFMTTNLPSVMREVGQLKTHKTENVLLIAGGPHAVGDPEGTLKIGFDAVSAGEGETTLPQICKQLLDRGREITGKIFRSQERIPLDESLPISKNIPLLAPLEITRGCHYRCGFCQSGRTGPFHRSLQSIRRYLDEMVRRNYLFRVGFICPSGFEYGSEKPGRLEPESVEAVLRMAKERNIRYLEYGIFPSEVRPNTVRPDFLKLIRKYCTNKKLTIGVQSGSERTLKRLKRGHTVEDIVQAASLTQENRLKPQLDFIIGFPGESREGREKTLTLIKKMGTRYNARNQIHFFIPLPGTPLENQKPVFPEKKVIETLDQYARDGICTDWWKKGMELSQRIITAQEALQKQK
ncbi:MAG: TIGR04013 family B12-binding domain/radical SAM domain-containing protein [bacterium]